MRYNAATEKVPKIEKTKIPQKHTAMGWLIQVYVLPIQEVHDIELL